MYTVNKHLVSCSNRLSNELKVYQILVLSLNITKLNILNKSDSHKIIVYMIIMIVMMMIVIITTTIKFYPDRYRVYDTFISTRLLKRSSCKVKYLSNHLQLNQS